MSDSAIESIISMGRIINIFKIRSQLADPQGSTLMKWTDDYTSDINHNIFENKNPRQNGISN